MAELRGVRADPGAGEFRVAVLIHSQRRLENLCRAARDGVPSEHWDAYLFATSEALEAEDFVGYPWTTLDDEKAPLLPNEPWPEEREPDGATSVARRHGQAPTRSGARSL